MLFGFSSNTMRSSKLTASTRAALGNVNAFWKPWGGGKSICRAWSDLPSYRSAGLPRSVMNFHRRFRHGEFLYVCLDEFAFRFTPPPYTDCGVRDPARLGARITAHDLPPDLLP